eukprot:256410-Amphidinium_carterae.1
MRGSGVLNVMCRLTAMTANPCLDTAASSSCNVGDMSSWATLGSSVVPLPEDNRALGCNPITA